jgi:futalosine hydrolase
VSTLYVYASEREAGPLAGDPRAVALGVGKTAAAFELGRVLAQRRPERLVVFGVAGTYATEAAPRVGEVCLVVRDTLADEGVATPERFVSLDELGLSPASELRADPDLVARVSSTLGHPPRLGGATVSTCSGTDERAQRMAARTGADVETMEGAAIAWVCAQLSIPWVAVRAVSNRTGDRNEAGWDLDGAASAVQAAVRRLWAAEV